MGISKESIHKFIKWLLNTPKPIHMQLFSISQLTVLKGPQVH